MKYSIGCFEYCCGAYVVKPDSNYGASLTETLRGYSGGSGPGAFFVSVKSEEEVKELEAAGFVRIAGGVANAMLVKVIHAESEKPSSSQYGMGSSYMTW